MATVHINEYDAVNTDSAGNVVPAYPTQPLAQQKLAVTTLALLPVFDDKTRLIKIWADGDIEWAEGDDPLNATVFNSQPATMVVGHVLAGEVKGKNRRIAARDLTAP